MLGVARRRWAERRMLSPLSRRRFLAGAGAAAVGTMVLPRIVGRRRAYASQDPCADPAYAGRPLTLVPGDDNFPYPFFGTFENVMLDDTLAFRELYRFARQYQDDPGIGTDSAVDYPRDHVDFWFRYLPIRLFEQALDGSTLAPFDPEAAQRHLWMMHLVGYYGGVWFGKKLDEFNPIAAGCRATSSGPAAEPTADDFASLIAYLEKALAAAYDDDGDLVGDENALFAFCRRALRFGSETADVLQPLIVLYGYNVGYTNNILIPPYRSYPVNATTLTKGSAGADPFNPPYNSQIANLHLEFGAEFPDFSKNAGNVPLPPRPPGEFEPTPYLIGDSPALDHARRLQARVRSLHPAAYNEVVTGDPAAGEGHLVALQTAASGVGNSTWSIPFFLDVKHWDARSYHQIVSLSVFFVQAVQAAGLACLAAAANVDEGSDEAVKVARNAALAAALVQPFGGSYLVGLDAGESGPFAGVPADDAIPKLRNDSGCISAV